MFFQQWTHFPGKIRRRVRGCWQEQGGQRHTHGQECSYRHRAIIPARTKNARMQSAAIQLGGPVTYFSAEEGAAMENPAAYARGWELWSGRLRSK